MPVAPEKWRTEIAFTTTIPNRPFNPFLPIASAYAVLGQDGFVVAANGGGIDAGQSVVVEIFDPAGNLIAAPVVPISVNRTVGVPDVARLSNGNIVVAAEITFALSDLSTDIPFKILGPDGSSASPGFTGYLNSQQGGGVSQTNPTLVSYSLGEVSDRFFAAWEDADGDGSGNGGIKGRLFQNNGTPVTATEFSINTSTAGAQLQPDAAAVSGGVVVVWTDFGVNAGDIRFRILADVGPVVGETAANPLTAGAQQNPSVATLSDGRFVIVWEDNSLAFDSDQGITGRIFNRDGTVSVESFGINSTTTGNQSAPHVTALRDGFVVTFTDPSGSGDVLARVFDLNANPIGNDILINTTVTGSQRADDIIMLADGRAVVGWTNTTGGNRAAFQIVDARQGDLVGDDGNNTIFGRDTGQSNPNDHIFGLGGADKLFGYAGDDTIDAGSGNDSVEGGAGADTLIGGPGTDRANYVLSGAGVSVSLLTGTGTGGDAQGDTLSGFEDLFGSAFADTLTGDNGPNLLNGRQGADVLRGSGGADTFGIDDLALADMFASVFDRIIDYNQGNNGTFSGAEGDRIDLSLFNTQLSANATNGTPTSSLVRLVANGQFADLQVDIDGDGNTFQFMTVARLDGLHSGDSVNVILSASQPAGVTITVPGLRAASDFNADARSDVLLQSTGGGTGMWLMNGPNIQSAHDLPPLPAGWNILGNADFNGDGKSDILLGTPGGALGLWQMNGPTVAAAYDLPTLPSGWHVVGDGDFGGDGKSDILLQSDSGGVGMWQMNGGQIAAANDLPPLPPGWHIAGVGDFGGDGKSDIILQSDSGGVGLWQMNGAQITSAHDLPSLPSGWSIEDVGDFNADGRSDVLLSTAGGALGLWLMNGPTIQSAHDLPTLPAGWEVAGMVDVGGDSRSDILLQNGSGGVALWQMNGPTVQSTHDLPTLPAGWHIAGYQYDLV